MRHFLRAAGVAAAVALAAACGSSDETGTACFEARGAEVCAEHHAGSVRISGEGLLPGSDLLIEGPGTGPMVLAVGDDGQPEGAYGLVGGSGSDTVVLAVSGTAADGTTVDGEIVSEPS